MHIYMHACIHTYIHAYIHTCMHAYIHYITFTFHYITLHQITLHYKTLHYINGVDKVGTKILCIGEVVDGVVVDVFFKYLKPLKKIIELFY